MYICICNAIRERDLRSLAQDAPGDAEALYARMGCQPQCGQCLEDADFLIAHERNCAPA